MTSLDDRSPAFKAAAEYAASSPSATKVSNNTKLELYGLYKYLTVSHSPNTKSPGIFDMTGRAKWNAWDKASKDYPEGTSETDVETKYIDLVRQMGWTESTPAPTADDESSSESGGGGGGLGVSVSQVARPPAEEDAKAGEDNLHGAVLTGDLAKVQAFLEKSGASGDDIDAKDEYGFTALHLAADRGYLPVVKILIAKGANLGVKDPDDLTAISLAQGAGHEEIVTFLEGYLAEKGTIGQGA